MFEEQPPELVAHMKRTKRKYVQKEPMDFGAAGYGKLKKLICKHMRW